MRPTLAVRTETLFEMPSSEPSQTEVDAKFARLTSSLHDLDARLRAQGYDFWADWVRDSLIKIEARDPQGLVHFRSAFGGMGSITDLMLEPDDDQVLHEAWALADWFGRQLRSEDTAFDWPW